jgi:hypothetical protein
VSFCVEYRFADENEWIFPARCGDDESTSVTVAPRLYNIASSEAEQGMPADAIATVSGAPPSNPLGRKLGVSPLVSHTVVAERHPSLLELLKGHARTVVTYDKVSARPVRQHDIDPRRTGVPSICDEFSECDRGVVHERPKRANEVVFFEQRPLHWFHMIPRATVAE